MGGITTGVGLFSGINTAQLIDQLLALDARPKQLAQVRIAQLQQQQAAYLDVNSSLLALKTASGAFNTNKIFKTTAASSTEPEVLTATAGTTAQPGTYQFLVKRLVSTQQLLSRGFADKDNAALGLSEITIESEAGGVRAQTQLSDLNGGNGVARGKVNVTDSSGATATIDLSAAVTVDDVLDAFNGASGVRVTAEVDGDRLVIRDAAGGGGTMAISNAFGYTTASSLGIAGTATGGVINGSAIRSVSGATALSTLNDGNGVNIRNGAADLIITARDGTVFNVQLGEITQSTTDPETGETTTTVTQARAATLQNVIDIINEEGDGKVTAAINSSGTGLVINDTTGGTGNLIVRSGASGRTTAKDLGIETSEAGVAANSVAGKRLISSMNSVLVSQMRGGQGVTGTGLAIIDKSGAFGAIVISEETLNGSIETLVDTVNSQLASAGVDAVLSINQRGHGLTLTDTSGGGGNLQVTGAFADQLGLTTSGAGDADGVIDTGNLQHAYMSRATLLSTLNGGQGIGTGTIRVTDASGGTATVNIDSNIRTVDDLIQRLESIPADISVSINSTGDGLLITDSSGIQGSLKIEDVSGTVAKSLNVRGEFEYDEDLGATRADGSFERTIELETTDSLSDVATKINDAGVAATATIIQDGSNTAPFRLNLSARNSGAGGRVLIDSGSVDLGLSTISRGDDALAFYGSADAATGVMLRSNTNSLDGVIQGVSIDLQGTSDEPVELVVTRDTAAMEKAIGSFVDAYNDVLDTIRKYETYDSESNRRGVLLGDGTSSTIKNRLFSTVQGRADGVESQFSFIFEVGVRIGSGAKLEFDAEKFREAFEQDPTGVENLFAANRLAPREPVVISPGITVQPTEDTFLQLGVAEKLEKVVEEITNSIDGLLTGRTRTLDSIIDSQRDRIDSIDLQLESKRLRYETQFASMERAIAQLQTQSSALSSLQSLG